MKNITYDQLNIVFEDNHLLVVVKPQNVPSQGDATGDPDMLTLLKQYIKEKYNKPGEVYLGLVHRLDRPTGGVMVFAKTSKAAERLSACLVNGSMEKRYLAVVHGKLPDKMGSLKNYLYAYNNMNIVKVVPDATEGAKIATLDYNTLAEYEYNVNVDGQMVNGWHSLVQIKLGTGRKHQIRVQMAHIGNALVGDSKYGPVKSKNPTPLALWAYELRFPHPITKDTMVFRVYPDVEQAPWKEFDIDSMLRVTMGD